MNSILDYFPKHLTPRKVQIDALLELEKNWNSANVFIINLPVASGKSAISLTISAWRNKAAILTPTNILVTQYKSDYPKLPVMYGKGTYSCKHDERFKKCGERKANKKIDRYCVGCPYLKDQRRILSKYTSVHCTNYYTYLAYKRMGINGIEKPNLIIDEAHNLINFLQDLNSFTVWKHKTGYPDSIYSTADLVSWINKKGIKNKDTDFIINQLVSDPPKFIMYHAKDLYYGKEMECIKFKPLDISECKPFLWPNLNTKIILLSATINYKDIEQLGLDKRKVCYIEADSPINKDRRPVKFEEICNMSYKYQTESIPKLVKYIKDKLIEHKDEKGLIHCTYSLAEKLKQTDLFKEERLIWHGKSDKNKKYKEFRDSDSPKVLVASGLYEGVDLPYDSGRWQIISKIPYPNLSEPAIKYKCETDQDFYNWETLKTVLQACGRVCRKIDDYGITYIPDQSFKRLYNNSKDLIPEWFRSSVKGI